MPPKAAKGTGFPHNDSPDCYLSRKGVFPDEHRE